MSQISWFRYYDEALDDAKVQRLSDFMFRAWVNLLSLANRGAPRGFIAGCTQDIAFSLRIDEERAAQVLSELVERDLLVKVEGGYEPHNWHARQYASDNSTERWHRWKNKQTTNVGANVGASVSLSLAPTPPESDTESESESTPPLIPPSLPKRPRDIHEAAMRLPGLRPEAMAVVGALEQAACELLDRNRLTKAQERTIRAFAGEMNGALTVAVIEAALTAAPQYKGGDQLAYLFQVIRNKVNGVAKVSNGNGSSGNGHSNGHSQGPPDGYSWEKDDAGRYIPLGGDPRTGKLPYGARDPVEANKRHREMSIQQRTTGGGARN